MLLPSASSARCHSVAGGPQVSHIVIEHSSNLRRQLNLPKFVEAIRQAALATGIFPRSAMHTRAYESDPYSDGARRPDNTFVHLSVNVGEGRDHATRRQACEEIFAAACEQLREVHARAPLGISVGISVEMQEREPDAALRHSNIHDYRLTRGRR
jgi:5-carboxymethyl-2-hydroxymuconate isomerase